MTDFFHNSEQMLRLLLESTAEAIIGMDSDGVCVLANDSAVRLLGYNHPTELVGRDMHPMIHHSRVDGSPYQAEACLACRAMREGKGIHVENEVLWRADGSCFPVEYWIHPIREDNQVVGAIITFLYISKRRRAQDELRQREALSKILLNVLPSPIIFTEPTGNFLSVNDIAAKRFNWDPAQMIGKNIWEIVPPGLAEQPKKHADEVIRTGKPVVFEDERAGIKSSHSEYRWSATLP